MTTLVVGASGATGRLLVEQLLERGEKVKIIVRSIESLPATILQDENISVISASILELSDSDMEDAVKECDTVVSCLGHTINFKGMYCFPRRLVTDSVRRLCNAIKENTPEAPVKFILMNSSGVSNLDVSEKISFKQKCVMALLRWLVPPHADNEKAADYLRTEIGQNNNMIEWTAVRPDGLINEKTVSEYTTYSSPIKSAIFEAGKVSRINVGHFMAELISNADIWNKWKGKMPVIYSKESLS